MIDTESKWTVYMHTNKVNGKKYIGITSKCPSKRWGNGGSGYKRNSHFWKAIQKYGWDNFKHEILLSNETIEYACAVEKCLIKYYKTNNPFYGYNLTSGGDSGYQHSEESRKKISESRKGKYTGKDSSMYGISPKARMDNDTYKVWLNKQQTNKPKGKDHPMYGVSPKERMDEITYKQWLEKMKKPEKSIPVMCIETNKTYQSAREAERCTGIGHSAIIKSCKSEDHSVKAGQLHWCFCDDKISIEDLGIEYKGARYIKCIETGDIYKTAREVKRKLGLDDSSISKCCKGKQFKTVGNLHWEYVYLLPEQYEDLCNVTS